MEPLTLDQLVLVEDALEMIPHMRKAQFMECVKLDARPANGAAWDTAQRLIREHGTRRKALNSVIRQIEGFRA